MRVKHRHVLQEELQGDVRFGRPNRDNGGHSCRFFRQSRKRDAGRRGGVGRRDAARAGVQRLYARHPRKTDLRVQTREAPGRCGVQV